MNPTTKCFYKENKKYIFGRILKLMERISENNLTLEFNEFNNSLNPEEIIDLSLNIYDNFSCLRTKPYTVSHEIVDNALILRYYQNQKY